MTENPLSVEEARRYVEMFIPDDADAQDALDDFERAVLAPYREAIREWLDASDDWEEYGFSGDGGDGSRLTRVQAADARLRALVEEG